MLLSMPKKRNRKLIVGIIILIISVVLLVILNKTAFAWLVIFAKAAYHIFAAYVWDFFILSKISPVFAADE